MWHYCGYAKTAVLIAMVFLGMLSLLHAQPIYPAMHEPSNAREIETYYRERLLKIKVTALSKLTNMRETRFGTGFLVSPDGYAITARHVIEPAVNDLDYENQQILIQKAEGRDTIDLDFVKDPEQHRLSELS